MSLNKQKATKLLNAIQSTNNLVQYNSLIKSYSKKPFQSLYHSPKSNHPKNPHIKSVTFKKQNCSSSLISRNINKNSPKGLPKKFQFSDKQIRSLNVSSQKNRTNNTLLNILLNNIKKQRKSKLKISQQTNFNPFTTQLVKNSIPEDTRLKMRYPKYQDDTSKYTIVNDVVMSQCNKEYPKQVNIIYIPFPKYKIQDSNNYKNSTGKLKLHYNKYLSGFRRTQNLHEAVKLIGEKIYKQQKMNTINISKKQNRVYNNNTKTTKTTVRQYLYLKPTNSQNRDHNIKDIIHKKQTSQYIDPWSTQLMSKEINFYDIHDQNIS